MHGVCPPLAHVPGLHPNKGAELVGVLTPSEKQLVHTRELHRVCPPRRGCSS